MKSLNIIGAGRLGKTLAKLLVSKQLANVLGVVNRTIQSAESAVQFIGQGQAVKSISELPAAELYLISTSDDKIPDVFQELIGQNLPADAIIFHCSGSLHSEDFAGPQFKVCSIHPNKSFADPITAVNTFAGTICAIEGHPQATSVIQTLFEAIDAKVITYSNLNKPLYHAASVFASNYLTTLFNEANLCYQEAGIDDSTAKDIVINIMQNTLNNLKILSAKDALTGPLKRKDVATIDKHLQALPADKTDLYTLLAKHTLNLIELSTQETIQLKTILEKGSDPHLL